MSAAMLTTAIATCATTSSNAAGGTAANGSTALYATLTAATVHRHMGSTFGAAWTGTTVKIAADMVTATRTSATVVATTVATVAAAWTNATVVASTISTVVATWTSAMVIAASVATMVIVTWTSAMVVTASVAMMVVATIGSMTIYAMIRAMVATIVTMISCSATCMMAMRHISMTEVVMTMSVIMSAMQVMGASIDVMVVAMCAGIIATGMIATGMCAMIMIVDGGHIIIEVGQIVIDLMNAEQPATCGGVDGTEEIIQTDEGAILYLVHDVTQVVIAPVQILIVTVDGIVVSIDYTVHDGVDRGEEVVVDLIAILVLLWCEVELIGHTIAQETSILTNLVRRKCKGLHYCGECQNHG